MSGGSVINVDPADGDLGEVVRPIAPAGGLPVNIVAGEVTISGDISLAAGAAHIGQVGIDTALPAGAAHIGQTSLDAALPAGAAHVGQVSIDAALPAGVAHLGAVTVDTALPAGAAHVGQVSIDAALPAGAAHLGAVAVDAALPAGAAHLGAVTIDTALPAGAAHLGAVAIDTALPAGTNSIGTVAETTLDTRFGNAANIGTGAQGSTKSLAIGDNTCYTALDSTKHIRVRWICLSASSNNSGPAFIIVKFTATEWLSLYLAPGAIWQRSAFRDSPNVNDTLVINLDSSQAVAANYDVDEY